MSTIRVVKHEKNFVILEKEILDNPEISLKAKGLWAYCMTKPNDWNFYVSQMSTCLKEGKDAIYSALNELIEYGYVNRIEVKDESGRYAGVKYEIFELSQLKEKVPQRDFPDTENPQLLRINTTKELKKEIYLSPTSSLLDVNEILKKELKKKIDFSEKEFEEAKKKLDLEPKGKIDNPVAWLEKVIETARIASTIGSDVSKEDRDRAWIEKIKEKLPTRVDITFGYNYIEFVSGFNVNKLTFGSQAFKEVCSNELRKRGLFNKYNIGDIV